MANGRSLQSSSRRRVKPKNPNCDTARGRQIRRALGCRLSSIEKLGNGRDKLRWRERLGQEDAVGYAMGWPFGCMAAGHIDNWEFRVDLSGSLRDFPTVHYTAQLDIGHKRSIFALDAISRVNRANSPGKSP